MRGLETVGGGCNGASKPETCARDAQTLEYRLSVFPEGVPVLAVEASSAEGWCKYAHSVLGMRSFGASAPAKDLHKHFGCDRRDAPVERAYAPRARVTRNRRRAASRPSPSWQRRASCSASTRADRCPTSCAGPTRRERALALSLCLSPLLYGRACGVTPASRRRAGAGPTSTGRPHTPVPSPHAPYATARLSRARPSAARRLY